MVLTDMIPADEYKKIEQYYNRYAMPEFDGHIPMPLYDFLREWEQSKVNLYHMLGDKLIYKVPYEAKKTEDEIYRTVKRYLTHEDEFLGGFTNWVDSEFREHYPYGDDWRASADLTRTITRGIVDAKSISQNGVIDDLTLDFMEGKKVVKITKGTKVFKAMSKIVDYIGNPPEKVRLGLEKFRLDISMIMNDAVIRGNLCLSIHPLDFMTMSDNGSNWSSCMSWQDSGCYRVGSVEMMNSNNVLCCYLESCSSKMPLIRKEDIKKNKNLLKDQIKDFWNDKKWRQLLYVNKDILVGGKAYPYASESMTKELLNIAKGLVQSNLGWYYKFGPELYHDMDKIDELYDECIDRDLERSSYKNSGKAVKKIYFTNKAMYNDMANDHSPIYWCYRNPIKHTKIINISGKTRCIYCSGELLEHDDNGDGWNERFVPTGSLVCDECKYSLTCDHCEKIVPKLYDVKVNRWNHDETVHLCKKCIENVYHCSDPTCDKLIFPQNLWQFYCEEEDVQNLHTEDFEKIKDEYLDGGVKGGLAFEKSHGGPQLICLCGDCSSYHGISRHTVPAKASYSWPTEQRYTTRKDLAQFTLQNAKRYELEKD